jgi:hypothetical protein
VRLADYRDYRGRHHHIVLAGDLILDTRRGTRPRVVCDLRAAEQAGRRRHIEAVVRDHIKKARRQRMTLRRLQPGELRQPDAQLQLELSDRAAA